MLLKRKGEIISILNENTIMYEIIDTSLIKLESRKYGLCNKCKERIFFDQFKVSQNINPCIFCDKDKGVDD